MEYKLRPYQIEAIEKIENEWNIGNNKTLLVCATGCGKTVIFANVIKNELAKNNKNKVLVLAHREELLNQAKEKINSICNTNSIIEKAESTSIGEDTNVVIASVMTIQGENRLNQFKPNEFSLIVIDEAHHVMANGYQKVMSYFAGTKVLGVTATADRGDKKQLGDFFDSIAFEYNMKQGIEDGYLTPLRAQTIPLKLNLNNVKVSQGDYQAGDLGIALEPYLDEIAKQIAAICKDKRTLVFTPLVETAQKLTNLLNKYGMRAIDVNGNTDNRSEILKDFESGKYNVISNPIVLTEGTDLPCVDCIVPLRATKIRSLFVQMVGRSSRLYPNKEYSLILDFLWLSERHDLIHPASLFCEDGDVTSKMTKMLEDGLERDLQEIEEQAQKEVIKDREIHLAYVLNEQRHKRSKFVDPLQFAYSIESSDYFGYSPIMPSELKKPTDTQTEWLEKHGINPNDIKTYGEADKLIEIMKKRYKKHLATPKQIRFLENKNFQRVGLWTIDEASSMIDTIANNNWLVPFSIKPNEYKPPSLMKRKRIAKKKSVEYFDKQFVESQAKTQQALNNVQQTTLFESQEQKPEKQDNTIDNLQIELPF